MSGLVVSPVASDPLPSPPAAARQITDPLPSPPAAARQITDPLPSPPAAARQTTATATRRAAPAASKKAQQVSQDFEALLLTQLLKGLRHTVPEASEKSSTSQMYYDLFDEQVASTLAQRGGIGLGAMIRAYLERSEAPGGREPKP